MRSLLRRGFTLIEVMIAVAIGTLVVAGLYGLFNSQLRSFVYQDMQMEMHQNARLALDVLTRSARQSGYGTAGYSVGAFGTGGDASNSLPAVISYDGTGPGGSDAVTFVSMDPEMTMMTEPGIAMACSTSTLEFEMGVLFNSSRIGQYKNGEMIMCYDYAAGSGYRSFLWTMTSDGDASTGTISIGDNTALTDYDTVCDENEENLPISMVCSRAEVATFYIDADDTDGIGAGSADHPVLMMDLDFESPDADDIPLVDNVEDFQVQYCLSSQTCATDPAGGVWVNSLDTYSDGDSTNDPGELFSVRFTVVVRSSREDLNRLHEGSRVPVGNNSSVSTAGDHYYRQVNATEVAIRNMRMMSTGGS